LDFTRVRFLRSIYRNDLNYGPTTERRRCVRVEVEVLGSHTVPTVSVDVKQQWRKAEGFTSCAQSRRVSRTKVHTQYSAKSNPPKSAKIKPKKPGLFKSDEEPIN